MRPIIGHRAGPNAAREPVLDRPAQSIVADATMLIALFAAIMALSATLAQAVEMPAKVALARQHAFAVHSVYLGWDRLAFLLAVEMAAVGFLLLRARRPRGTIVMAFAGLIAAQAIFWIWAYPASIAMGSWAVAAARSPLGSQWVYAHLACAVLQLIVLGMLARLSFAERA